MEITFLIGNGFDLNCGLDCSYISICKRYIKSPSSTKTVADFKKHMSQDIATWGAFEERMAQSIPSFKSENDFLECLFDFTHFLDNHLQNQEIAFYERIKENAKNTNNVIRETRNSIDTFYKKLSKNEENHLIEINSEDLMMDYHAIVFNYTTIFDFLWKNAFTKLGDELSNADSMYNSSVPIHIHGNLNNHMLIGVDNEGQLSTPFKFHLSKRTKQAFVKPLLNNAYDRNRIKETKKTIKSSDVICVFGMSLGDTDSTWRNLLSEWLFENEKHQLFYYWYEYAILSNFTLPERIAKMDEARIRFLKELMHLSSSDSCKILHQVHIPCCSNIFNINNVIEKPIFLAGASPIEKGLRAQVPKAIIK